LKTEGFQTFLQGHRGKPRGNPFGIIPCSRILSNITTGQARKRDKNKGQYWLRTWEDAVPRSELRSTTGVRISLVEGK